MKFKKYDYLIVGTGMFGSVFARIMTDHGKKCLVIDKRDHIGGLCYTENVDGINIHKYGAHIFHTFSNKCWNFINRFAEFNNYRHRVYAISKSSIYSLPINLMTLFQLFGVRTPEEAERELKARRSSIKDPKNLEEWCSSKMGWELYLRFVKDYTEKSWCKKPSELSPFLFQRLPVRLTFDNDYFSDTYQGIPIGGFTEMFWNLLHGIEIKLNADYFDSFSYWDSIADKIVYTGKLDDYFYFKGLYCGGLDYIKVNFIEEKFSGPITLYKQGSSVINYCDSSFPYLRTIEHKHFEKPNINGTVISKEFHSTSVGDDAYPIEDELDIRVLNKYKEQIKIEKKTIFGGRLAEYKYMDIDDTILSALEKAEKELCLKN